MCVELQFEFRKEHILCLTRFNFLPLSLPLSPHHLPPEYVDWIIQKHKPNTLLGSIMRERIQSERMSGMLLATRMLQTRAWKPNNHTHFVSLICACALEIY